VTPPPPPPGPLPRLHAITDERVARRGDLDAVAGELAAGGGAHLAFHARGRGLSGLEQWELANRLSAFPPGGLFVNDRLDVALAAGARGVQLRRDSLSPGDARRLSRDWWIGVSVHDLTEARAAQTAGADYLLLGPVFATATHPDQAPLGLDRLAEITTLGLPLIAIGGVTAERIAALRAAGAYGVAAIRALWEAVDPAEASRRMVQELEAG
jgi:thiamine-phosphate pyrophosphorylase